MLSTYSRVQLSQLEQVDLFFQKLTPTYDTNDDDDDDDDHNHHHHHWCASWPR